MRDAHLGSACFMSELRHRTASSFTSSDITLLTSEMFVYNYIFIGNDKFKFLGLYSNERNGLYKIIPFILINLPLRF